MLRHQPTNSGATNPLLSMVIRGRWLAGWVALLPGLARAGSFQAGPYLQDLRRDGITVCWTSGTLTRGTVDYWPLAPAKARRQRAVEPGPATYHRVALSGLQPRTRYAYSVPLESGRASGSFVTAAAPGQPFRFVALGDTRTNLDRFGAVAARARESHPDFVLHLGDLVEDGRNERQWQDFFTVGAALLRSTGFYPVLGNHELSGAPYFRYFGPRRDYSFDYGDAHFTLLDGNRPVGERADQDAWLRSDLATHQEARWRIVALHPTLFSAASLQVRRLMAIRFRARLLPILREGRVALILSGHDHTYQHHVFREVHQIVSGGGGAPLSPIRADTPFVVTAKSLHHFCGIEVSPEEIRVRALEADGSLIEQFSIRTLTTPRAASPLPRSTGKPARTSLR
jgi:predicted phosphodiesterase